MTGNHKRPETGSRRAQGRETDKDLAERLQRLDQRLGRRESGKTAPRQQSDRSGYAYALKLSSEFVAAILVGAGLGWLIDRILGTAPWAMIVLLMLGFCAGVLNVLRAAGRIAEPGAGGSRRDEDR